MRIPVRLKLKNLTGVIRFNENEPGLKTKKYFDKTRDGKVLLRKTMEKYIPKEITQAKKQGFSAPDASWFKGGSINYIRALFFKGEANVYNFLDKVSVQSLINEHLEGKQNRRLFIWSLLNFEWWLRRFI
jgi:asparagine synthase (glutamine-hydrolysing)